MHVDLIDGNLKPETLNFLLRAALEYVGFIQGRVEGAGRDRAVKEKKGVDSKWNLPNKKKSGSGASGAMAQGMQCVNGGGDGGEKGGLGCVLAGKEKREGKRDGKRERSELTWQAVKTAFEGSRFFGLATRYLKP